MCSDHQGWSQRSWNWKPYKYKWMWSDWPFWKKWCYMILILFQGKSLKEFGDLIWTSKTKILEKDLFILITVHCILLNSCLGTLIQRMLLFNRTRSCKQQLIWRVKKSKTQMRMFKIAYKRLLTKSFNFQRMNISKLSASLSLRLFVSILYNQLVKQADHWLFLTSELPYKKRSFS